MFQMKYRCKPPSINVQACHEPRGLHVDQVSSLWRRGAGRRRLLPRALRVCLVLVVALVLDGLGAAVRVAVVVKKASEGELVEGVFRVLSVAEPDVEGVVIAVLVIPVAAPHFIRVHGIKVGGVCGVGNGGDVRCHLLPEVAGEVDAFEEGMSFDFVRTIFTEAVLGAAA